jgi:hypothetical protein
MRNGKRKMDASLQNKKSSYYKGDAGYRRLQVRERGI